LFEGKIHHVSHEISDPQLLSISLVPQCAGIKRDGTRCSLSAPPGVAHCYNHDPLRADERRRNAARAGKRRSNSEISTIKEQLADLYAGVLGGEVEPKVGAVAAQIANVRIRLLEAKRRAKELEDIEERLEFLECAQRYSGRMRR
jgi:hypothetical protein